MRILKEFWLLASGHNPLSMFFYIFLTASTLNVALRLVFASRKIQPNGFKWRTYRNEALFGLLNVAISGILIGALSSLLSAQVHISVNKEHASWWVVASEYLLFFIGFDTWFYWLHRLMHIEPVYSWVHKLHHKSTSPNVLTTFSVNPLESLVNGSFIPLLTAAVPLHAQSLMLMNMTVGLMGLYVHCGYEFLPRWWNKSWATKWLITTTFHDQHHKYFNWNFGGFTPVWDYLCGTVRKRYEADFATRGMKVGGEVPASLNGELSQT